MDGSDWTRLVPLSIFRPQGEASVEAFYSDLVANDPVNFPIPVPTLLEQGVSDTMVSPSVTLTLADRLRHNGTPVTLQNVPRRDPRLGARRLLRRRRRLARETLRRGNSSSSALAPRVILSNVILSLKDGRRTRVILSLSKDPCHPEPVEGRSRTRTRRPPTLDGLSVIALGEVPESNPSC